MDGRTHDLRMDRHTESGGQLGLIVALPTMFDQGHRPGVMRATGLGDIDDRGQALRIFISRRIRFGLLI